MSHVQVPNYQANADGTPDNFGREFRRNTIPVNSDKQSLLLWENNARVIEER